MNDWLEELIDLNDARVQGEWKDHRGVITDATGAWLFYRDGSRKYSREELNNCLKFVEAAANNMDKLIQAVKDRRRLQDENKRLRKALEFFAEEGHYDYGAVVMADRAWVALEEE